MENLLCNKIVLLGPYVGGFKEEIFIFRPFVEWFKRHFECRNLFVSTHYSSSFLYREKNVHIFKQYTRDKNNQKNHIHKNINSYDYQAIKKAIIDNILSISNYKKSDIISYDLGYSTNSNITYSQKIYTPIDIEYENHNQIIFIPDDSRKPKEIRKVKTFLSKEFPQIEQICFDEISYKNTIKKLLGSKAVLTPSSHWTLICNLHKKNVFSWGRDISIYKEEYNFNNENCRLMRADEFINNKQWDIMENYIRGII